MNRRSVSRLVFGLMLASLLVACNRDSTKTTTGAAQKSPTGDQQPGPGSTNAKVELKVITHAELVKAIESHKGKVVLVDFWATWCKPCIEKFPKIAKIHDKHKNEGLVLITVSFDEEAKQDKALEFLKEQKAVYPNYLVKDAPASQEKWDFISIPTYLIYGKDGTLAQKFPVDPEGAKPFTVEEVQEAVQKQLK